MIKKEIINSDNSPKAIGPYSQAILIDKFIFISGQIPLDKNTNNLISSDFKLQVFQCLNNIKGILKEKDLSVNCIIKMTVYLTDLDNFSKLNDVFIDFFDSNNYPARAAVEVSKLPKDSQVEIDAICIDDN